MTIVIDMSCDKLTSREPLLNTFSLRNNTSQHVTESRKKVKYLYNVKKTVKFITYGTKFV